MKKVKNLLLIIFFVCLSFMLKAQQKYAVAELTYTSIFGKVTVMGTFDEGNGKKAELLRDADGNKLALNSIAEMLNIICSKGWKVLSFVKEPNAVATSTNYIVILEKQQ